MEIFKTCQVNLSSCAIRILHSLPSRFQDELALEGKTGSGLSHSALCPVRGSLLLGCFGCSHACALLDAWRLLVLFSGESAKVAVVLPHSLRCSEGGKVQFTLLAQLVGKDALCVVTLASYSVTVSFAAVQVLSSPSEGVLSSSLHCVCSVPVLHFCLHGKL